MKQKLVISILAALALLLVALLPLFASSEDGTRDSITATPLANTGVTESLSAASGDGHSFSNTGEEFIIVTNNYTDTVTMTVVTGGTIGGLAIADVDVALAAGATSIVGPFAEGIFNQTGTSDIYINWNSAVTGTVADSVTLAVFQVP
jgi:hypothetical protein